MSASFELDAPDHFTAGTVGQPGQRVFYLQARQARRLVTLKCEKEQVAALGEYLAGLLAQLSPVADTVAEAALLEPIDPAWAVGSIGVGYDRESDRIIVEATEAVDEDDQAAEAAEAATARFRVSRAQAAAFVERARALIKGGRPACSMCGQAIDPGGHVCPRANGHHPGRA